MSFLTLYGENYRIAVNSIRSNLLRTILTILIIAFGIMALVGILTAIDAIRASLDSQFSNMGSDTFSIRNRGLRVHTGKKRVRGNVYKYISYKDAQKFKEEYKFPATVSITVRATGAATVKYQSEKTNPNVSVTGVDENYLSTSGYTIAKGRNFSGQEILDNRHYVIIGGTLSDKLFKKTNPIGKTIIIGPGKYKVIGVLEKKGQSMGGGGDNICFLPYTNVRQYFSRPQMAYTINIKPDDNKLLEAAIGEAVGTFRVVRKLKIKEDDNFEIIKSDNLVNMLMDMISYVTIAATLIGIITLLGAAVGLMNIMLVSVTERTREIGTRKALGAKSKTIKQQFLFEAILIGQFGGVFGIIFGILLGNIVSMVTGGPFIIPWIWITGGVVLCLIVSLVSGITPAVKASKLDPIIALRYE